MLCKVGKNELELFKIHQVAKAVSVTNEAIRKKESRGKVPPTMFRDKQGERLYSVEDIAMYEYFFKHLWSNKQGVKVPEELAKLIYATFVAVRKDVLEHGKLVNEELLEHIPYKYEGYEPGVLYSYILHWRSVLTEDSSFIDDLLESLA